MLGRSQEDLLRFTSLTQMAIQSSGAGAQEAVAGVIQLGQALASGQLRGDELRSVLENLNGVAIELAAGLGVSVGELRSLAEAGKLTSQSIVEALLSRGQQIEERFAALPVTVGQAFTALRHPVRATASGAVRSFALPALPRPLCCAGRAGAFGSYRRGRRAATRLDKAVSSINRGAGRGRKHQ